MALKFCLKSLLLITILVSAAVAIDCPAEQKDNGNGTCIPSSDPCAKDYHDDGTGNACIGIGGTCAATFHDDGSGTKCIASGEPCAPQSKDDGTGQKCVAADGGQCAQGFKDDGKGVCIYSAVPCAVDFHDDGAGTGCIMANGTCADNYIDDGTGQKCILNCTMEQKNNGQGLCIGIDQPCATGYTSDDPATTDNCNACSEFYKNDGSGTCVSVFSDCAPGYKDNGEAVCVLLADPCAPGYTSDNELNDNCFACDSGYRDDGEACSLTTDPCAIGFKDDGNGTCIDVFEACVDGYKDDGTGTCVLASSGCGSNFIDDGNGNCIIVIEEYIIIFILYDPSGKPARCDPTCSRCVLGGQCTVCKVGYALDPATKQCVYCDGCLSCNGSNPAECTGCFYPQLLNRTAMTCVDVVCEIAGCLQCNLDSTCKVCEAGYTLISDTCQKCVDENCKSCSASLDVCDADGCLDGYIFGTKKNLCLPCATGCKRCRATDISECVGCNSGYYASLVDGKNTCVRCFQNCDECSGATKCLKCAEGFIVSTDGSKCEIKCSDNCATCDSQNPDKCLSCYSGADLVESTGECITNLGCNANSSCSACSRKYVIFSSQCFECTYSDPNCVACTNSARNTCARCLTGYYLKNGECKACTDNCVSCLGKGACIRCSPGYFLVKEPGSSAGKCKLCDGTCTTCADNPTICTACPASYNLEGSSCVSVHKVVVVIKLNIFMGQFLDFYDSLILWFVRKVTLFRPGRAFGRRQCIFKRIVSGSVSIDAALSLDSADGVGDVANGLTNAMNSGTQEIDGLTISGSAVGSDTTTASSDSSSNSVGLILGIVIPLVLIAVIVVIVKVYDRKQTGYEPKEEESNRNYSGKHFNSEDKYSEKV